MSEQPLPTSEQVHKVCEYLGDNDASGHCQKCPRRFTEDGEVMGKMCYSLAEETILKVWEACRPVAAEQEPNPKEIPTLEEMRKLFASPPEPAREAIGELDTTGTVTSDGQFAAHGPWRDTLDEAEMDRARFVNPSIAPPTASVTAKVIRALPCKQCGAKYDSDRCLFPNDCHCQKQLTIPPDALRETQSFSVTGDAEAAQ